MHRFIKVGRILRPRGLKGQVLVKVYSYLDSILVPGLFFIKGASGHYEEYVISGFTKKGARLVVCSLRMVDSREAAERISGEYIFQEASRLPAKDDDEFYWFQLKGLKVFTTENQYLGDVHAIIETGASDVLVVRDAEREVLIPMVEGIIDQIDLHKGHCVVEPLPGLLDATTSLLKGRASSPKSQHDI